MDGQPTGAIGKGLLVMTGFGDEDGPDFHHSPVFEGMARKLLDLRIFPGEGDRCDKFDRSARDCGADVLLVPQFTLYADCRKGRRPSFSNAGDPAWSREMFDRYGVDGVMIGRATYGRPWIFREVKHYLATGEVLPQPSVCERVEIAKEHLRKSLEIKGEYVGILEMRRHLSNYFKGLPDFKPTRLKLVTLLDIPELFATLDSIAERWGDFDVSGTVPEPLSHDL